MTPLNLQQHSLEEKISLLVQKVGKYPSREFFELHPYLRELSHESENHGGLEKIYQKLQQQVQFELVDVPIPSARQKMVGALIAHDGYHFNRKKINADLPGTGKTGAVLCAIDAIQNYYLPKIVSSRDNTAKVNLDTRLKTVYVTPSRILPVMVNEARKFLPQAEIAIITPQNRSRDIDDAKQRNANLIFVGYSLGYRDINRQLTIEEAREERDRKLDLAISFQTRHDAHSYIERLAYNSPQYQTEAKRFLQSNPSLVSSIDWIVKHEDQTKTVIDEIKSELLQDQPYYAILGEAHNIVGVESLTAQALTSLFHNARWGVLETGTLVKNSFPQMSYLMHLLGFVEDPKDFARVIKSNSERVKASLSLYLIDPVISHLEQIDPAVPKPNEVAHTYEESNDVINAYTALLYSDAFTRMEKTLLARQITSTPWLLSSYYASDATPFYEKVQSFLEENNDIFSKLTIHSSQRLAYLKKLILEAHQAGEKSLVFCEYDIAEDLRNALNLPLSVITQRISCQVDQHGYSKRDLELLVASVNPDSMGVITTSGVLGEGNDGRSFTNVIYYQQPTLGSREEQTRARSRRRGQRKVVTYHKLQNSILDVEQRCERVAQAKVEAARAVFNAQPSSEAIDRYLHDTADSNNGISLVLPDMVTKVGLLWHSLTGIGSTAFATQLALNQNAQLLCTAFNHNWAYTNSAACGQLLVEILEKIESDRPHKIEEILEGGAGPAQIARTWLRPSTLLDIMKLQLEYGESACDQKGITNMKYFLGSIHDLSSVVEMETYPEPIFFESSIPQGQKKSLADNHYDAYIASQVFYYLDTKERASFFAHAKRILNKDVPSPLILLIPRSKIDPACESKFLSDIEQSGFEIDLELSGEYAAKRAQNVQTGDNAPTSTFNPYVIVAYPTPDAQYPDSASASLQFELSPNYKIIDSEKKESTEKEQRTSKLQIMYSSFYRKQAPIYNPHTEITSSGNLTSPNNPYTIPGGVTTTSSPHDGTPISTAPKFPPSASPVDIQNDPDPLEELVRANPTRESLQKAFELLRSALTPPV